MQELPEKIGPWRILGLLGRGSAGAVYRALHEHSGQMVALKTLPAPSEAFLPTLRREIHALSRLRHPGIVRILESGSHQGMPWLAMELLEGLSLRDCCSKDGAAKPTARPSLPVQLVLTLVRRLCAALGYLHGEGLIHRDLKPENILSLGSREWVGSREIATNGEWEVQAREAQDAAHPTPYRRLPTPFQNAAHPTAYSLLPTAFPVLVDFGLASEFTGLESSRESLALDGAASGTLLYMAPEQIEGRPLDARADLYSLGSILYELLCGHPPFEGTAWEVCQGHLERSPRPLSEQVPALPAALEALVLRLLSKEPRHRPGYASDVAAVLGALGAQDDSSAGEPRPRAYLYRPGFTGRSEELGALLDALEGLKAGRGGLTLIGGESGVGKTRLLVELGRQAARRALRVLSGECLPPSVGPAASEEPGKATSDTKVSTRGKQVSDATPAFARVTSRERRERNANRRGSRQEPDPGSGGGGAPLGALSKPLQAIADRCRELGARETERLLGRWGRLIGLYEPSIADLPGLQTQSQPPELPLEAARLRLFTALLECFTAMARIEPLVLLLDDLHWADELSLGFLQFLAGNAETLGRVPLLVVGAYRTEELGASPASPLRRLLDSPQVRSIALERLEPEALAQMVGQMLSLDPPPELFVRFLARQSEGNPFFLAEYLRTAVTEEVLYRDAQGFWQVAEPSDVEATEASYETLPLPGTLRELVTRRLGALGRDARGLLEASCVLGRELGESLLAGVVRMNDSRRDEALRELLARQVLEEAGPGTLRFLHDKLREVAYEQLPRRRRLSLHRTAARTIQKQPGSDRPEGLAILGRHWELGGETDRARPCYLQAAQGALSRYAHEEAERLYRSYLRLSEGEPLMETLQARAVLGGEILAVRGRYSEALRELAQALEEARRAGESTAEAKILHSIATCYGQTGRGTLALEVIDQSLSLARRIGDRALEARALHGAATNLHVQGRIEEAEAACLQALQIQRQLDDPKAEGLMLRALATLQATQGHLEEAEATAETGLVLLRKAGNRAVEAVAVYLLAAIRSRRGDPDAGASLEQALALYREVGNRRNEGVALGTLADWRSQQGRSAEAIELNEQALAIAQEVGDRPSVANHLGNLANEHAARGEPDLARRLNARALALNEELNTGEMRGMVLGDSSILERRMGDLELAEAMLRRAGEIFLQTRNLLYEVWGLCQEGHLLMARGQPARHVLERILQKGEALRVAPGSRVGKSIASLCRAVEAFEAGRRLHCGECVEDLPEGLHRWLVEYGKLAPD